MNTNVKTVHGVPVDRIGGYTGQILWVNLTTGDIHTLSTYDYVDYIGGRAMGASFSGILASLESRMARIPGAC